MFNRFLSVVFTAALSVIGLVLLFGYLKFLAGHEMPTSIPMFEPLAKIGFAAFAIALVANYILSEIGNDRD